MEMVDARQVLREGLATGTHTLGFRLISRGSEGLAELREFSLHGGQIGVPCFLKQVMLLRREGLAFIREANPAMMGQLQRECGNLGVAGLDEVVFDHQRGLCRRQCRRYLYAVSGSFQQAADLLQQRWIEVFFSEFGK